MRQGKIGVVLLLACAALFAVFGTARARQAWTVDQAHAKLLNAKTQAMRSIARAQHDGLTKAELAPLVQRTRRIDSHPEPKEALLWQPSTAVFYSSQAAAYRAVPSQVRACLAAISRALRVAVLRRLEALQLLRHQAIRLGMSDTAELRVEADQMRLLAKADTPGRLRTVLAKLNVVSSEFNSALSHRQRDISGIISNGGGTKSGVSNAALAELQQAQSKLDLLTVLRPIDIVLGTALQRQFARVREATNVQDAAVKYAEMQLQTQKISDQFSKVIPAKMIVISTENQTGSMYENGRLVYSSPVTTGGPELPTDHGIFHIYLKLSPFTFHSPWSPDSPYYYPPTDVQFWMPFFEGEGLHDASWRANFGSGTQFQPTDLGGGRTILGTHGCVNLPLPAAQFVWNWAPVGTTVAVI